MLDLKQIENFYPENLRPFKRNLIREYLQYKILSIIFDSEFGHRLFFMGGTALRIVHQHTRFSEDLDFDNLDLNQQEFKKMSELIKKKLDLEGYTTEIKNVFKGAYHCYLKISKILYNIRLSEHKEENLLIQIDAEPQMFKYKPEQVILNKFDIFLRINVVPLDILAAQKIYAIFHRKRSMGRDFYDLVFLLGRTKPNLDYLKTKMKISNMLELKMKMLAKCKNLDFKQLAKDVEPFLISPDESKKVLYFYNYISQSPRPLTDGA